MRTFGINQEKKGIEAQFLQLCEKIVLENDLSLYDLDYLPGQNVLRIFIMDKETQTAVVEDCAKIDRALDAYLEESWMPASFTVEVSSPGIFRALRSTEQFEWSLGKRISVTIMGELPDKVTSEWTKALKSTKKFIGELQAVEAGHIVLNIENSNLNVPIAYELIKSAQWEPKF